MMTRPARTCEHNLSTFRSGKCSSMYKAIVKDNVEGTFSNAEIK